LSYVNKNIIRRNFWHGKTKLVTLSAIYLAPCQQSGKDGIDADLMVRAVFKGHGFLLSP
jgi:hypothetical protein